MGISLDTPPRNSTVWFDQMGISFHKTNSKHVTTCQSIPQEIFETAQREMESSNKFTCFKSRFKCHPSIKKHSKKFRNCKVGFTKNLKATGHCSKAHASLIEESNPWDLAYPASAHKISNTYLINTTCKYQREHSSCK